MRAERMNFFLTITGAILFNWLFWNEKMAVNTILYDLFIIAVLFSLYPNARHSSTVRWLLAGHLICLAMLVLHNSSLSKFATVSTLFLISAFAQFVHRSAWFAAGSVVENALFAAPSFLETVSSAPNRSKKSRFLKRWVRFLVIPLLIAFMFFVIYSFGNSVFLGMTEKFGDQLFSAIEQLFQFLSPQRFAFLLLGLLLTTVFLLRSKLHYFSGKEKLQKDELLRERQKKTGLVSGLLLAAMGKLAKGMMAIKNINTVGLISLVLLNVLLLVVNSIDISYIWIGFNAGEVSLYRMVHEGANILVLSIVLAIIVLLLFFKGNLNFYRNNKWLKRLAYLWIAQNMVLVVSVSLRDFYYIREAGLGRNRIGILFYLLLVVIGLITVAWKIHRHKTVYYLLRVNAWAAIAVMVAATTVNWDQLIVDYNLSRKDNLVMPVFYMVTLSDSVLPTLDQHREDLRKHIPLIKKFGYWELRDCENCWETILDQRILQYKQKQKDYSWLSWSRSDQLARAYFKIEKQSK